MPAKLDPKQSCLMCRDLQEENDRLRKEIDRLNGLLALLNPSFKECCLQSEMNPLVPAAESRLVTRASTLHEKMILYRSLFHGREDVYARRFESKKTGKSGYSPVCRNEWIHGVCPKPKTKCQECMRKDYVPLDDTAIEAHFRGKHVLGIYPLLPDHRCWFLVMDFDGTQWKQDIDAVQNICEASRIPIAVERSRSGVGGHAWFFFDAPILAAKARRFGAVLITSVMQHRHEIGFKSYDRLFPSQDTLPDEGLGNLIALPLQGEASIQGNSCFLDRSFEKYADQWLFLSGLRRMTEEEIDRWTRGISEATALGTLGIPPHDGEDEPWRRQVEPSLDSDDFPSNLALTLVQGVFVPKEGLSQRAMNRIIRLAAFPNPEFYKKQAMHFSTWDVPRIITCHQEHDRYIQLPRGCQDSLERLLTSAQVQWSIQDKRVSGHAIHVSFKGALRPMQQEAVDALAERHNGVLCASTAFGKTVVAIGLIARHRTNALILVDSVPLMLQWHARIEEFLDIQEELPEEPVRRGRKKKRSIIGRLGGSRDDLRHVVDIALFQSLMDGNEIKEIVRDYGMVIVDECHHVGASTFERVMAEVSAMHVYGLSATPARQDGKDPIVHMQCGPIVFHDKDQKSGRDASFERLLTPRFTRYILPPESEPERSLIQHVLTDLTKSEERNAQIVKDALDAIAAGRETLVLTDRKDHVERLVAAIESEFAGVWALTGAGTERQKRERLEAIRQYPKNRPILIVATGKYVGEGFDLPRLDTLLLAMPFSWKGTLAQYAGRLNRNVDGKREVKILDYVDIRVPVLDRMFRKRLKGYRDLGYRIGEASSAPIPPDFIFGPKDYLETMLNDFARAKSAIWISSMSVDSRVVRTITGALSKNPCPGMEKTAILRSRAHKDSVDAGKDIRSAEGMLLDGSFIVHSGEFVKCNAVLIDQRILWYGSLAPLGYHKEEDSILRIESPRLAGEMRSVLEMPLH